MSGKKGAKSQNPWGKNQPPRLDTNGKNVNKSEQKFKEVQAKMQQAVQKHVKEWDSSSEEEEELQTNSIISKLFEKYKLSGGLTENLEAHSFVTDVSGVICAICISSVKRSDPVWNCKGCFSQFHLNCIQLWSKNKVFELKQSFEDAALMKKTVKIIWDCPKCRYEYDPSQIPMKYLCFCQKAENPPFQPLLVPHSCGDVCHRDLKPLCGHKCLMLCHRGPCMPCPQNVKVSCLCGRQTPQTRRCNNKEWSCKAVCDKLLECKIHKCGDMCHKGDCQPCPKKSLQKCVCGAKTKLRECASPVWQCDVVCGKPLECGHHNCEEACHIGKCEPCSLSKTRTCPCGKSSFVLECTKETPTCGDTCGKVLECGIHICFQRCHKDKCGMCLEFVKKFCRCGLQAKEVQCRKVFTCETKCKNLKDCLKHPCNRKCCEGNCPPCEKPCGRTLKCGNHKCSSVCHRGECYPCNLTDVVYCRCRGTSVTVPCGRKKRTRPPKCSLPCKIRPNCHHEKREKHNCHFDSCPPCEQICNKTLLCSHKCPSPCHSGVLVMVEGQRGAMPWEQTNPHLMRKSLPCPDCVVPVSVTCPGEHETSDWPCYAARGGGCGRSCGRVLKCGNHKCFLPCHLVENASDGLSAGSNCLSCENECQKERPEGCTHKCPNPCHSEDCPPCKQMLRVKCLCGLNQPYVVCSEWTSATDKTGLESCGNQCPKNYPCGHRCRANCHAGECLNPELCQKKVKIFCNCKRIKREFSCELVRANKAVVSCDDACFLKQKEEKRLRDLEAEHKRRLEEVENRRELEKYEKLFHGKKKVKDRKVVSEKEEKSFFQKYWLIVTSTLILVIAIYFIFS
uniref:PHD-type domain-containing protein n=4 Tax=Photinus pyralis TaxID=7054 RepID=A0A1Y1M097_PHOPY